MAKMQHCRNRQFTHNTVIGSNAFVIEALATAWGRFGPDHEYDASKLKGEATNLTLWRFTDLRKGIA
jgi:hypothetical protein